MTYLSRFQTKSEAFRGFVSDAILGKAHQGGVWPFGQETISLAASYFLQSDNLGEKIEIGLVNGAALNATWYKVPEQPDVYAIGINVGLINTLKVVAYDIFGYGDEADDEPLRLGHHDADAASRVSERLGAFLELGCPLGNATNPSERRTAFVRALLDDAYQFVVLHEFAHIALGHDRGDVRLLRKQLSDVQIATFSIGQEHQADQLAARLHASIRRTSTQQFPGMEFAGPTLFLGILGLFERYSRHQATFDTPHSHPPAYERLYRLRVGLTSGKGHMYWPVHKDGSRLARMELKPNPKAVEFSDAIGASLLAAIEQVEASKTLPSPITDLVNRFASAPIGNDSKEVFRSETARWMLMGSPEKVLQHVSEGIRSVDDNIKSGESEEDVEFWTNARVLLLDTVAYISKIRDICVQDALAAIELRV